MHESVMTWVERIVAEHRVANAGVLEVGSQDFNGSVRPIFTGSYHGVDMLGGTGVDEVADAHNLPMDDRVFDVVVSTEMLEHDSAPWRSIQEMARVVKLGGLIILTARGYDERGCFPVHGYPEDHWRYSLTGMRCLLEDAGLEVLECISDPEDPGVFALARRRAPEDVSIGGLAVAVGEPQISDEMLRPSAGAPPTEAQLLG